MVSVSSTVKDDKVIFEYVLSPHEPKRNEAWAIQQQSVYGYRPKHYGFFEFKMEPVPLIEGDLKRLTWWCFKDRKDESTLAKQAETLRKAALVTK